MMARHVRHRSLVIVDDARPPSLFFFSHHHHHHTSILIIDRTKHPQIATLPHIQRYKESGSVIIMPSLQTRGLYTCVILWFTSSTLCQYSSEAFSFTSSFQRSQSQSITSSSTRLYSSLHPAVQGWPEKYAEPAGGSQDNGNQSDSPPLGPRVLHNDFTVEPASEYTLYQLDVRNWPTWTTGDKEKWAVGNQNRDKVMPYGELSFMIQGKLEIIPCEGTRAGQTIIVQEGDFVTFPFEFKAHWRVLEEVTWHYYLY